MCCRNASCLLAVGNGMGRVPDGGVASRSNHDAGFGRAGQAAPAGRLTMGSSLIGAMLSSVM